MGKFNSSKNNVYQELKGALPGGVWAMPAYFNNTVYYGSVGSPIKAFTIANAQLAHNRSGANYHELWISGRNAQRFSERHKQWNCLGS